MKSSKINTNSSGLSIEISNLDYNNDKGKISEFINSKNWDYYLNACKSYGFMIDLEIPWRLVADIGSSTMIEYAKNYSSDSTDSIIINYYEKAAYSYYNNFSLYMYNIYNLLKLSRISKLQECNGNTNLVYVKPKDYGTLEQFINKIGKERILSLYCNIRFLEEESKFTEQEKKEIIRDTKQISNIRTESFAINQFESLINKTFDYQGSLGYYVRGQREREQQEIFGETTSTSFTDSSPARRGGGGSSGGGQSSGY